MIARRPIICIEAKRWWEYWILLEINTLAYIIFLFKERKNEKIFIFLIFQTLSSALLIIFIFIGTWATENNIAKITNYIILISIVMKIGIFPFHNWLIKTIKNISWLAIRILFTWQKIIPIILIMKISTKIKVLVKTLIISILLLNFILMKISNIKIIITISSLIHNRWIILPLVIMKEISLIYLLSYTIILIPLIIVFIKTNIKNIVRQTYKKSLEKEIKFLMISIRGIPPSIGFIIKMMVLTALLIVRKKTTVIATLILSSCITFYVYLQTFVKYFLIEKSKTLKKNYTIKRNEIKEVSWAIIITPIIMWC